MSRRINHKGDFKNNEAISFTSDKKDTNELMNIEDVLKCVL